MKDYLYILKCDNCGKHIYPNDYHLGLENDNYPIYFSSIVNEKHREGFLLDSTEEHFCSGKCLGEYVDKRLAELKNEKD